MGNIKFLRRKGKPNKKGLYTILMEITKNSKRGYITLNIEVSLEFWDSEQERLIVLKNLRNPEAKEANELRRAYNITIERYNLRARDVIDGFDRNNVNWTINQFKEAFHNKPTQGNVLTFLQEHIKNLKETNHIGNSICYESTLLLLYKFDNKFNVRLFSEIDYNYVCKFDVWLDKRGCKRNTRLFYFKTLRAILNKAIKANQAQSDSYPFGVGGFSVADLAEETEKRYLPSEYLIKLKSQKAQGSAAEFARLLFLFSYYTYGMSFIDMAFLKRRNIVKLEKGTYIVYKRQKVKNKKNNQSISIKITTEIESLITRITAYQEPVSDYLLPIITIEKETQAESYEHITNRRKRYGKNLKKLATEFEWEFNLTSYVSRHTMAMQLQENSISDEIISQVMNHKDLKTTKIYLDQLDTSVIDKAGEVL